MPSFDGQGQSALATEAKVRGISYALAINLAIYGQKFAHMPRYRYWHFDLNAGSGFNDIPGCIGTPLTFLEMVRKYEIPRYFAGFCDCDADRVKQLLLRPELRGDEQSFVLHGDNSGLVDAIPDLIGRWERPEKALGSVISDDNATGVPVAQLAQLALICPCLDIIVHWNSTSFKRVKKAMPDHPMMGLVEAIAAIAKPHWWIREPISKHGFTLLVGRGIDRAPQAALGFHRLDSLRGQHILRRCSLTATEQLALGPQQGQLL